MAAGDGAEEGVRGQGVDADGFVGGAGCEEGKGGVRGCEPGAGGGMGRGQGGEVCDLRGGGDGGWHIRRRVMRLLVRKE